MPTPETWLQPAIDLATLIGGRVIGAVLLFMVLNFSTNPYRRVELVCQLEVAVAMRQVPA